MKRKREFPLPPGLLLALRSLVPTFTREKRGTVQVKCLAREHNIVRTRIGLGPKLLDLETSALSNHEAAARKSRANSIINVTRFVCFFQDRDTTLFWKSLPNALLMNSLLVFFFQQTKIADVKNIFSERIRRNSQSRSVCTTCPRGRTGPIGLDGPQGPPGPEGKAVIDQFLDPRG